MQISRRWLNWKLPEPAQEDTECELTKPTKPILSVLSVHEEGISELMPVPQAPPGLDLEGWLEPMRVSFVRWVDSACALHPRAFGGVAALQISFCEWLVVQGVAPCDREIFVMLLGELGLPAGEVAGVVLVSGLVLKEDLEAY